MDWCTNQVRIHHQTIEMPDEEGPEYSLRTHTCFFESEQLNCSTDLILSLPDMVDNCSEIIQVQVLTGMGLFTFTDDHLVIPNYNIPRDTITYIAYDACWQQGTCEQVIMLEDHLTPAVICDENTAVSLTGYTADLDPSTVQALVHWTTFDDGTYDNCGIDSIRVRRMETIACGESQGWNETVAFCCEDIGQTIQVMMGAWDLYGNFNSCMVNVEVSDKLPRLITAPPDVKSIVLIHWILLILNTSEKWLSILMKLIQFLFRISAFLEIR